MPVVGGVLVVFFIALSLDRSTRSVVRTSKKSENQLIVMLLLRIFLAVVTIARVEGQGSFAPDSCGIARCQGNVNLFAGVTVLDDFRLPASF